MNRLLSLVLLVLVGVLVAGCVSPEALPPEPDRSYIEPPLPDGAGPVTTAPAADFPEVQCERPTASLRPTPAGIAPEDAPPTPTVDAIRERGRLTVGLDTGSNLFSFRDPMSGKLVGFDVDIAREISRDLFGDPDRVDFRILTSAERIEALQESTVDVVVKTMTITCARKEEVSFSTVYFQAQHRVLAVRGSGVRGVADLANRRVCAVDGTTSLRRLQRIVPTAQILTAAMWSDCLVLLQQRQVDVMHSSPQPAQHLDRRLAHRLDLRVAPRPKQLPRDPDPKPIDPLPQLTRKVLDRLLRRPHIVLVESSDRIEHQRCVLDRPRQRPHVIQRPRQRHYPTPPHPPVRRLQPHHST